MFLHKNLLFIAFLVTLSLAGVQINETKAANCGGGVVCACGDTVIASTTLTADISCSAGYKGDALIIGAPGVTVDGGGHSLNGGGDEMPVAININDIDNVVITNFASINQAIIGVQASSSENITISYSKFEDIENHGGSPAALSFRAINLFAVSSSTVEHVVIKGPTDYGIYAQNSHYNNIRDNHIITAKGSGINLQASDYNELSNNTLENNGGLAGNSEGIRIGTGSDYNLISNNILNYNDVAIGIWSSANNTVTSNQINYNNSAIVTSGTNSITNNISHYNALNNAILWTEQSRLYNANTPIDFAFRMRHYSSPLNCPECTYSISSNPAETISAQQDTYNVSGRFTPTRPGTYSLNVTVNDTNGNSSHDAYLFIIGPAATSTIRYYTSVTKPQNAQAYGSLDSTDAKSLIFTPPTVEEYWGCGSWVQNAIEQIPEYPLSQINSASVQGGTYYLDDVGNFGLERFSKYTELFTTTSAELPATDWEMLPIPDNINFSAVDWMMDGPRRWNWFSLKFRGLNPNLLSAPANPISLDISRSYAQTANIKNISNKNLSVLSATASSTDTKLITIALRNVLTTATSTTLTIAGVNRPFINATTTINYLLEAQTEMTVGALNQATISNVPLDIIPSAGEIAVNIETWNTSGDYYKKWKENSNNHDITTAHTLGNLLPEQKYRILVNGESFSTATANSEGSLSFNYTGGYSEKVFEVIKDAAPVITITGDQILTIYQGSPYVDAGAIVQDDFDNNISTSLNTNNQVNTAALGTYFVTYSVIDSVGNQTTASRSVVVIVHPGGGYTGPINNCSLVEYEEWGACINNFQIRNVISQSPATCSLNTQQQLDRVRACGSETIVFPVGEESKNSDETITQAQLNFTKTNQQIINKTLGNIVLQTQQKGEAWYVNPYDRQKYYLGRPSQAFSIMQNLSTGISNAQLKNIPIGLIKSQLMKDNDQDQDGLSDRMEKAIFTKLDQQDSDSDGFSDYQEIASGYNPLGSSPLTYNKELFNRLKGRILLQVENNGEAWYLNPLNYKRYYLGRPEEAFAIMQELSLGISDQDLNQIPVGTLLK